MKKMSNLFLSSAGVILAAAGAIMSVILNMFLSFVFFIIALAGLFLLLIFDILAISASNS